MLAFLPHILDSSAAGRVDYLNRFNSALRATAVPMKFYWLQGGDQFEFEEQLRMGFG